MRLEPESLLRRYLSSLLGYELGLIEFCWSTWNLPKLNSHEMRLGQVTRIKAGTEFQELQWGHGYQKCSRRDLASESCKKTLGVVAR